jgi:uncharacterized lipoprotein YmbA
MGLLLAAIVASGCALTSPRPDPTKYYVLTALPSPGAPPAAAHPPVIGLGPVNLPGYLDHNELVTRAGPNEIDLSDVDRWAGPLDQNFKSVLARNLGELLGANQVMQFPWYSSSDFDYKIEVNVSRFDADESGNTTLSAKWIIREGHGSHVLMARETDLSQPAGGASAAAEVAALSADLGGLSQAIAGAIVRLQAQGQAPAAD